MFNRKILILFIVGVIIFGGCKSPNSNMPPDNEKPDEPKATLDLSNEAGIKDYLVGEWNYDKKYTDDVTLTMKINNDLQINLVFYDALTHQLKEEYTGEIILDWVYADSNEAPDALQLKLNNAEYFGGEYFFLHRTSYDDKYVMSWFIKECDSCVFNILGSQKPESNSEDMLGDTEIKAGLEEVFFERVSSEVSNSTPLKNTKFHAVYWGLNNENIWLDEVKWSYKRQESASVYPYRMTLYKNDDRESVLYSIAPEEKAYILKDELLPGELYYVETNDQGLISMLVPISLKLNSVDDLSGHIDPSIKEIIIDVIENDVTEIKEFLNMGMGILISGETMVIEGVECYLFFLGRNTPEQFNRELMYAINPSTRQVYFNDVLVDEWIAFKKE